MLPLQGAQIQFLTRKLRSCMPGGTVKKKERKKKRLDRADWSIKYFSNLTVPNNQLEALFKTDSLANMYRF